MVFIFKITFSDSCFCIIIAGYKLEIVGSECLSVMLVHAFLHIHFTYCNKKYLIDGCVQLLKQNFNCHCFIQYDGYSQIRCPSPFPLYELFDFKNIHNITMLQDTK